MQDIKDSVGDGGRNDVHDVALVQAILRVVKTKAGVPHLSGNYDGAYGPVTKEAIIKFQTNQLLIGPVPSPEKVGLVARESVTFQKMVASLPENYKGMRIIQGTKTVYLEDAPERAREARAKLAHYGLQPAFRQKVGSLIAKVYAEYKIVVSVTGHAGGRRTFQEQRAVPITNTKAGPGESNHNFGNAADLGFRGLTWIKGDGTPVTEPKPWLEELEAAYPASAKPFWKTLHRAATDSTTGLFRGPDWDNPHIQAFNDNGVSMGRSLAALLTATSGMLWEVVYAGGHVESYKCDLRLGGGTVKVGKSKQIWDGAAPVTAADIVTILSKAKLTLLQARNIWAGKPAGSGLSLYVPPKIADIKATDLHAVKQLLKRAFVGAEANRHRWTPVK